MKKRRASQDSKPQIKALWQAMDEAAFGAERTLNLRELLPSAAEARARTEVWLKGRQVTKPEEVLIITGRGNQSAGGIGVVRQEVLGMLPALRRKGIVESWREHTPGSLVVKLAPLTSLLAVGKRRRDGHTAKPPVDLTLLEGLQPETVSLLRQLALASLASLGIEATDSFVNKEMIRVFSTLIPSVPHGTDREVALRTAMLSAIDEAG
jgi:hypothetical protein